MNFLREFTMMDAARARYVCCCFLGIGVSMNLRLLFRRRGESTLDGVTSSSS
jgi:hypothetical protein